MQQSSAYCFFALSVHQRRHLLPSVFIISLSAKQTGSDSQMLPAQPLALLAVSVLHNINSSAPVHHLSRMLSMPHTADVS